MLEVAEIRDNEVADVSLEVSSTWLRSTLGTRFLRWLKYAKRGLAVAYMCPRFLRYTELGKV
jgi:hypothetical protein